MVFDARFSNNRVWRQNDMKWQDMRQSGNVEDVRGRRVSGPVAAGGLGVGGLIVLLIASAFNMRRGAPRVAPAAARSRATTGLA